MSLQFIIGNSGAGKSHYLYHRIIQESMQYPKEQYLVLVPEQFTLQTQKELVMMHPRQGIMNIDVLSFERLAFRVLEEVGENQQQLLEETGKSLVLRKVAQEKKAELQILGTKMQKPGYITQMKSVVSEFIQYDISEDKMEQMLEAAQDRPQLLYKLKDMKILYEGFKDYLKGRFLTGEEVLEVLAEVVEYSSKIQNSILVLDGFTGFTPLQNKLIRQLLPLCKKIYVTVTLDKQSNFYQLGSPHQIFYMSQKTIHTLCQMAKETKTTIETERWIEGKEKGRFAESPALSFLEQHLFCYNSEVYQEEQKEIEISLCKNPQEEIKEVVNRIGCMVREKGYRYQDFAVITGDLNCYKNYAAGLFQKAKIPYFLDEKHSILMNPFVEYVRAIVDIAVQNYSYESMFRFLRCGFSVLEQEEIDLLENYVIALGIRGQKQWKQEWVRHYRGQNPEQVILMEEMREKMMGQLEPFLDKIKCKKFPVKEAVKALYQFLVDSQVQMKLKKQEQVFESRQELALMKEYSQIYGIVMNLFDKMIEVLGEETVSAREFQELIEAGLEEAKVGLIPPSVDQVVIGDMERTRLKAVKVLFFVGVNEGKIPKDVSGNGLLSDIEREYLKQSKVEIAPTAKENIYVQRFYLYLNLTKPSKNLYLSYSKSSENGESIGPAYLIHNLQKRYPKLRIVDVEEREELLEQIQTPENSFKELIAGLRETKEEHKESWQELFTWYSGQEEYQKQIEQLIEAAFLRNPQDRIGKAAAAALYGENVKNSATHLERFAACAFAHFAQYGLKLQERQTYEFNAADMGNIVHCALECFAQKVEEEGCDWEKLTQELREQLVEDSVEQMIHEYGNTILHSSARNEYMITRVKRLMNRTVWALQEQMKRGIFKPTGLEVRFETEDALTGRIDRVDTYEDEEHVYVKVIDYKSGNMSLDLVALYHGLQLQLVLYLNAAMKIEAERHPDKKIEPAGIFYYNVKDPVVEAVTGEKKEELEKRILKVLRMSGLVAEEKRILEKLDREFSPEQQKISLAIPAAYNKDGSLTKNSSAVSQRKFHLLSDYVNYKVKSIGARILDGEAQAAPYELGKKNACTYCAYRGICGFDEKIPDFEYRRLEVLNPEELWEQIEKEV